MLCSKVAKELSLTANSERICQVWNSIKFSRCISSTFSNLTRCTGVWQSTTYPTTKIGNMSNSTSDLTERLRRLGMRHSLLCLNSKTPSRESVQNCWRALSCLTKIVFKSSKNEKIDEIKIYLKNFFIFF